ncbi:hypothetical protein Daesc_009099 [Daldinia eschscholtzii]|uniref:Uncharacterized protein n=1 Tax=Daldinia eschscholtzii TaxID=292717 RepID=A0AAX6M9H2_9PEZI
MGDGGCPDGIYIKNQVDIDNGNYNCGDSGLESIYLINASGDLTFPGFVSARYLQIEDSPDLQSVTFPDLRRLSRLQIKNAHSLYKVSLPSMGPEDGYGVMGDPNTFLVNTIDLSIEDAPSLTTTNLGQLESFKAVTYDSDNYFSNHGPGAFDNITAVWNLTIDACVNFVSLERADRVQIAGDGDRSCQMDFSKLSSVNNMTLHSVPVLFMGGAVTVNESLVVESWDPSISESPGPKYIRHFTTVGSDLRASANSQTELTFTDLQRVGGDLVIYNNKNSTLSFDQLTEAGTISIVDNADTILPWFPRLQRADSIHLRGYIDTSMGQNLFPVLSIVPGNVTIEAWNADFNCSKLVDQFRDNIIANLKCNGTNNATGTAAGPITNPVITQENQSSGLSAGAWAGIGVGIAIFVLGVVIGVVWLLLRLRRLRKELMERIKEQETNQLQRWDSLEMRSKRPNLDVLCESDGTGIIREKPDDHVPPDRIKTVVAKHPDGYVRELPVTVPLPPELTGSPDMEREQRGLSRY